jgi:hypothetical protein
MTEKLRNRARCLKCNDIIESTYRHDFVKCKCGAIFVDGGNDYWRAGATDFKYFERLDNEGNKISPSYDENDV